MLMAVVLWHYDRIKKLRKKHTAVTASNSSVIYISSQRKKMFVFLKKLSMKQMIYLDK